MEVITMSSDFNKINEESLENVSGGVRRTVHNDSVNYANVRCGAGLKYDVEYKVYNGTEVYTTGRVKYADGYDWYELDDGCWIAGSLIGY